MEKEWQMVLLVFFAILLVTYWSYTSAMKNLTPPSSASTASRKNTFEHVILFDGVCNFCNSWVDTVRFFDRQKKFRFTGLQSEVGKEILQRLGRDKDDISSVVYIRNLPTYSEIAEQDRRNLKVVKDEKLEAYYKSDVALLVSQELLGIPAIFINLVRKTVPNTFRDALYDIVANNRYKIMGKRDVCRIADAKELSELFL